MATLEFAAMLPLAASHPSAGRTPLAAAPHPRQPPSVPAQPPSPAELLRSTRGTGSGFMGPQARGDRNDVAQ